MIVELIVETADLHPRQLRIPVKQLVLRQNNGTIVAAAADMPGEARSQQLSRIGDPDFQNVLRQLGIAEQPQLEKLHLPPGQGRLIG